MTTQQVKNQLLSGVLFDGDLAQKSIVANELRKTTKISDIWESNKIDEEDLDEEYFWKELAMHSEDYDGLDRYLQDRAEARENIDEKINQEYQDNMRDELFNDMAMDAMQDLGLTEDEAERELEDFK